MGRMVKLRWALPLASALVLSACVDAEDCDPNAVGNVVTSAFCSGQGQFDQRISNLQLNADTIATEVQNERLAVVSANTRIRSLQAEERLTADQVARLNDEIAALQSDLNRLAQTRDPATAAALRERIRARKAAINAIADVTVI